MYDISGDICHHPIDENFHVQGQTKKSSDDIIATTLALYIKFF